MEKNYNSTALRYSGLFILVFTIITRSIYSASCLPFGVEMQCNLHSLSSSSVMCIWKATTILHKIPLPSVVYIANVMERTGRYGIHYIGLNLNSQVYFYFLFYSDKNDLGFYLLVLSCRCKFCCVWFFFFFFFFCFFFFFFFFFFLYLLKKRQNILIFISMLTGLT